VVDHPKANHVGFFVFDGTGGRNTRERTMLVVILIVILILVLGGGGYGYRSGNNISPGAVAYSGQPCHLIVLFLLGHISV
jgi:hypothetical protein